MFFFAFPFPFRLSILFLSFSFPIFSIPFPLLFRSFSFPSSPFPFLSTPSPSLSSLRALYGINTQGILCLTFKWGIAIWESPIANLSFLHFLKTNVQPIRIRVFASFDDCSSSNWGTSKFLWKTPIGQTPIFWCWLPSCHRVTKVSSTCTIQQCKQCQPHPRHLPTESLL